MTRDIDRPCVRCGVYELPARSMAVDISYTHREAMGHDYLAPTPYRCAKCGLKATSIGNWSRVIIQSDEPTMHYLLCPDCTAQLHDTLDTSHAKPEA